MEAGGAEPFLSKKGEQNSREQLWLSKKGGPGPCLTSGIYGKILRSFSHSSEALAKINESTEN